MPTNMEVRAFGSVPRRVEARANEDDSSWLAASDRRAVERHEAKALLRYRSLDCLGVRILFHVIEQDIRCTRLAQGKELAQ